MGNNISSTYSRLGAEFAEFARDPPFTQSEKFLEAVGKQDHFLYRLCFLKESICNHLKIISQIFNWICENEKDIAKDQDMKKLVREYIDNCFDSSKFYRDLEKSLRLEKARQRIIEIELEKTGPGRPPLSEKQQKEIKEKFKEFVDAEDPFENFLEQSKSLFQRHKQMRKKVEKEIQELSRKRKTKTIFHIVSGIILMGIAAALTVFSVVVQAVSHPGSAVQTAVSAYTGLVGTVTELMGSFRKEDSKILAKREVTLHMNETTYATAIKMESIRSSVKSHLNCFGAPIVLYMKSCLERDDVNDLAEKAKEIKKLQEPLMQKLDELCKDADHCAEELENQGMHLMQLI